MTHSQQPSNIDINIEQLVLDGFAPQDRWRIAQAIEQELPRLIAERGVPTSLHTESSVHQLDAGSFQSATNARAATVGTQVAQSIYNGMIQ